MIDIVKKDRELYGSKYKAYLPQDPASAGQLARKYWSKLFAEQQTPIYFYKTSSSKGKLSNFEPFAASSENGLVEVVKDNAWNLDLFNELESFDNKRSSGQKKDDQVDSVSACFNILATKKELPSINAKLLKMS